MWNRFGLPAVWEWYVRELFKYTTSNSAPNVVGVQEPDGFLRIPDPTKRGPSSDGIAAGAPNLPAAGCNVVAAFLEPAFPYNAAPTTRRGEPSGHVVVVSPFTLAFFMTHRPAWHAASE